MHLCFLQQTAVLSTCVSQVGILGCCSLNNVRLSGNSKATVKADELTRVILLTFKMVH